MLALLLSLSNPETGWQEEMALEATAVTQTSYHLPSMRTTSAPSLISLLNQNFRSNLKPVKAVVSKTKAILLKNNIKGTVYTARKEASCKILQNTRLNLPLLSRRPQVPCWVMWKHILHLTHGYSFFSLFTNCTHADGVTIYSIVLSMSVTEFNIILLMIKITI